MDAIGFGLEQYDATGAFRTHDEGTLIEPAGVLPGQIPFADGPGLGRALREHPDLGPCMTDKLLTYALGRGLEDSERSFVQSVVDQANGEGFQPSALVDSIVTSPLFTVRGIEEDQGDQP